MIRTSRKQDSRPAVLRTWMGLLFIICLSALLAAIVVLFRISRTGGLHQSPLTFQRDLRIFKAVTTFAPYSIVPTVFAVCVKLWFAAIGDTSKRLQPYIAMLKTPSPLFNSVLVEYANTPTALVSLKAFRNGHWILALVGVGAFATEACESIGCAEIVF